MITEKKTPEKILNPSPLIFTHDGEDIKVMPMEDGVLMNVTDNISNILGIIDIALVRNDKGEINVSPSQLLPFVPAIVKTLIPNSTALIASAFRKTPEWVQDNLRIAERIRAIKLILEAEDIPLIIENFTLLVGVLQAPKTPNAIVDGSTSSSPLNMDGK